MMKHRAVQLFFLTLLLLACAAASLVILGYERGQASQELILAIKCGDTNRVLEALCAHADPNIRDQGDVTPSLRSYLTTLWQQVRGIKPPPPKAGSTALGLAVYQGNIVIVEALLSRGAKDVNDTLPGDAITGNYIPLLTYAVEQSHPAIVRALLKHGWSANTVVKDPAMNTEVATLHYVNDAATVRVLLDFGADPSSLAPNGWTTLDQSLELALRPDIIEALLDAGAGDARSVTLALHVNDPKTLQRLFALGWTVNRADLDGSTPLMYALGEERDLSVARRLLQMGANVNCRDAHGESPLLFAADGGYANPDEPIEPQSLSMITDLLRRGAKINVQDNRGMTPLMVAASHLRPSLVQLLLKRGAQVNLRAKRGETALTLARQGDVSWCKFGSQMQSDVVRLLVKAGATK